MNYYETLYIIHPALDGGRIKEMVLSVDKILKKTGGASSFLDIWGKKKLAYEIDKQRYGTYILVQFSGDGSGNAKFNMELEHNPNILAYLTTRIDDEKLREQRISLEEQITGDSPPSSSQEKSKAEDSSDKKVEAVENNDEPSKEPEKTMDEEPNVQGDDVAVVVSEDDSEDQAAVASEDDSEDQAAVASEDDSEDQAAVASEDDSEDQAAVASEDDSEDQAAVASEDDKQSDKSTKEEE